VLPSTKADIHLEEVEELECGCIPKGICHTIGTETQANMSQFLRRKATHYFFKG
jgi:hypothetical protein